MADTVTIHIDPRCVRQTTPHDETSDSDFGDYHEWVWLGHRDRTPRDSIGRSRPHSWGERWLALRCNNSDCGATAIASPHLPARVVTALLPLPEPSMTRETT